MRIITVITAIFFIMLLQGCTIHFKGSDVELDAQPALTSGAYFELESIDLFKSRLPAATKASSAEEICLADF